MNVYEEVQYPFLRDESRFLQQAAATGVPVLGICLGAQMIAKAAGAAVTKNRVEEVGWSTVTLTAAAAGDPLFRGLPAVVPVFQWHGDTFAIPDGGVLLATGSACAAPGLSREALVRAAVPPRGRPRAARGLVCREGRRTGILRQADALAHEVDHHARTLFANFLAIAQLPR